jgi:exodeoxyribonuclease V beta subunit
MNDVHVLNPETLALEGLGLIEASAGTGKTYTLAALYLRLLLGLAGPKESCGDLGVENLLVVTFTEAATQELRDRIRQRIREARWAFLTGQSQDPFLQSLLEQCDQHEAQAQRLDEAASAMDQASVFTIHGFCQRMLKQHAFESGSTFNVELTTDDQALVRQAVLDTWRAIVYPLSDALADEVLSVFKTPDDLLASLSSLIKTEGLKVEPDLSHVDLDTAWQGFFEQKDALRTAWLSGVADLPDILLAAEMNGRVYQKARLANWIESVTAFLQGESDTAPSQLDRFSNEIVEANTKKGSPPNHAIFDAVDAYFKAVVPIKEIIQCKALNKVRTALELEKQRHKVMGFDDLLGNLAKALNARDGERLAHAIRQQYPVALIDEFQDTDPLQYRIFSRLYAGSPESQTALFMIGDPKQSIYAFRGGDIFTYMMARREVQAHYTLDTNWRSTTAMVSGVNALFEQSRAPFMYPDDIPFLQVKAAGKADQKPLTHSGKVLPAINAWFVEEPIKSKAYFTLMAANTAHQISSLLSDERYDLEGRHVQPDDIAVLVRDRNEARYVQSALANVNVACVYLSNRQSVFDTQEARELLYLLQAIQDPADERKLRTAIASGLFAMSVSELDQVLNDEVAWEALVDEFIEYQALWLKIGVLPMIHHLLDLRSINTRLLAEPEGERRLTDLLHLAELLQTASQNLEGEMGLLRWFMEHIAHPNVNADEQQMRLESERKRVTIITIHKSKGLEYNIVFLPFISRHRAAKSGIFHDESGSSVYHLSPDEEALKKIDQERLAEDVRLLYVALTRPVHACYLGIADICYGNAKKPDSIQSALGYLLMHTLESYQQNPKEGIQSLRDGLTKLQNEAPVGTWQIDPPPFNGEDPTDQMELSLFEEEVDVTSPEGQARPFRGSVERNWRVTSYSGLSKVLASESASSIHEPITDQKMDVEVLDEREHDLMSSKDADEAECWDIHHFPKGATAGTFLHSLFEEVSFSHPDWDALAEWLTHQLPISGFDSQWQQPLMPYLKEALLTPLAPLSFSLSDISDQDRKVEMEFVLPFKPLHVASVNRLLRQYDPLAQRARALKFDTVQGMLKGFIDLTFRFNGQYFVLDYKSNYLGEDATSYTQAAMQEAMVDHRYDFQYVLYTLALHRLLKVRLPEYDYDRDVGGVVYLFLRGLDRESLSQGVFYTKPDRALIESLDHLLNGSMPLDEPQ